jgi:glyceraldehyde-3-phosphate dehydrogenase/erythrose-4-phosphate dehydrogenase
MRARMAAPTQGKRHQTRYLRLSRLAAVLEGSLVKVVSWHDNEWGYSNRCVELAQRVPVRAHA